MKSLRWIDLFYQEPINLAQRSIWVGPAANIVTLEETGYEVMAVADSWVESLSIPFRYNKMSNANKAAELRPCGRSGQILGSQLERKEGICVTETPEWLGQLMLEPAHLDLIWVKWKLPLMLMCSWVRLYNDRISVGSHGEWRDGT